MGWFIRTMPEGLVCAMDFPSHATLNQAESSRAVMQLCSYAVMQLCSWEWVV